MERLGGFQAVKDVLAEDHLLGLWVRRKLGKRVVVARTPVVNFNRDRSLREFWGRYARWGVLQRQMIGGPAYAAQLLLNPVAARPGRAPRRHRRRGRWPASALACAGQDRPRRGAALPPSRPRASPLRHLLLIPAKDLLLGAALLQGFLTDEVAWRGTRLRVLRGTRLAPGREADEPRLAARA